MKISRIIRYSLLTLVTLGVAGYLVYVAIDMSKGDPEQLCTGVTLKLLNPSSYNYIDNSEIERVLSAEGVHPKGCKIQQVDTKRIEALLEANDFIAEVECYKTSAGKLNIEVVQRIPVIYVLPDGDRGYYLDRSGSVIPPSIYRTNIVAATGTIDSEWAKEYLTEFGSFIMDNEFWNSQIEQIYVCRKRDIPEPCIELIPRVGDHRIILGTIDGYESKLRRLKVFYDKAIKSTGWGRYKTISLQYDGQVICEKK